MCEDARSRSRLNIHSVTQEEAERYLNPKDINVPQGYEIEVFASGFDAPSCMVFTENGELLIAESGMYSGNARVLILREGRFDEVAGGFRAPITGINYKNGNIYVSHKGYITVIKPDGVKHDILSGLPSNGDYGNSNIEFGLDGKMYFGQGTATNSGIVGVDNRWVMDQPFIHDSPGGYILLNGQNFVTNNILSKEYEIVSTGAYSPFGDPNMPYEIRKGVVKASGSILRANLDGTELELIAWGFRYPSHVRFDHSNRLFVANQGFEDRGSRPIVNAPDEFHIVIPGIWYGWPDYAGGEPVTLSRFRPEGGKQPEFLLTNHPNLPPRPFAIFPPFSSIMGFDFNYNSNFGPYGDAYIAEYGGSALKVDGELTPYAGFGHRISKIDMSTGGVTTFAINKSGFPAFISREGGFGRPIDVVFGPDNMMYVVDFGRNMADNAHLYLPNTGVIWRIIRI